MNLACEKKLASDDNLISLAANVILCLHMNRFVVVQDVFLRKTMCEVVSLTAKVLSNFYTTVV